MNEGKQLFLFMGAAVELSAKASEADTLKYTTTATLGIWVNSRLAARSQDSGARSQESAARQPGSQATGNTYKSNSNCFDYDRRRGLRVYGSTVNGFSQGARAYVWCRPHKNNGSACFVWLLFIF